MPGDNQPTPSQPGMPDNIEAVTPADGTTAAFAPSDIYIETGGDVCFISVGGQTVTVAVADTSYLPARAVRIKSTDTTATGIFRVW